MSAERANLQAVLEPITFQRIVLTAFELSPEYREVFFLCDMQDFTIAETGTILGINEVEVTSRLAKARHEMYKRMRGRVASC